MNSIHDICKEYNITNYTINDDGSIDVDGNVRLCNKGLTELPIRFNKVTGVFSCADNSLTTLKGSPKWVDRWFKCHKNKLTSLEFSPKYVGGSFSCNDNQLTSLEFSPDYVGSYFSCEYNCLTTNYCKSEINSLFYTTLKQNGLSLFGEIATNYNEWRKLYKRKKILDDIFNM
jgi:hypothetical protein